MFRQTFNFSKSANPLCFFVLFGLTLCAALGNSQESKVADEKAPKFKVNIIFNDDPEPEQVVLYCTIDGLGSVRVPESFLMERETWEGLFARQKKRNLIFVMNVEEADKLSFALLTKTLAGIARCANRGQEIHFFLRANRVLYPPGK